MMVNDGVSNKEEGTAKRASEVVCTQRMRKWLCFRLPRCMLAFIVLNFHVSVRLNAWVSFWFGVYCLGWIAFTHGLWVCVQLTHARR